MSAVKRYTQVEVTNALSNYDSQFVRAEDYDALTADKADDLRRMAHDANTIHALQSRVQALEADVQWLQEVLTAKRICIECGCNQEQCEKSHIACCPDCQHRKPTQSTPVTGPETKPVDSKGDRHAAE